MPIVGEEPVVATLVDPDDSLIQRLLRWRWGVVALSIGLFVVWEVIEHPSAASMLHDRHIFREALFFAIMGPLLTGLALTLLARTATDRVQAYRRLTLTDELSRQLADAESWEELTALIVSSPRRVLPVTGTSLLVASGEEGRLDVVTEWWDSDNPSPTDQAHQHPPCGCRACTTPPSSLPPTVFRCHGLDGSEPKDMHNRYCLPLKHAGELVGLLCHHLPDGVQPTAAQSASLDALGGVIAVALDAARAERANELDAATIRAERMRIARDLHDTLGQSLGYLHLKLDQLTDDDTLQEITAIQQELKRMSEVANESYQEVRDVVTGLRARTATELAATLEERARKIGDRAGLEVKFVHEGAPHSLNPHAEQQVFFIVQEMLNNVAKHADAHRVELTVAWEPEALSVACSDDGKGFDSVACQRNGHFGLQTMRERAEEIGGELSIASSPGSGTKIALSVPTRSATPDPARHGERGEDPAR